MLPEHKFITEAKEFVAKGQATPPRRPLSKFAFSFCSKEVLDAVNKEYNKMNNKENDLLSTAELHSLKR